MYQVYAFALALTTLPPASFVALAAFLSLTILLVAISLRMVLSVTLATFLTGFLTVFLASVLASSAFLTGALATAGLGLASLLATLTTTERLTTFFLGSLGLALTSLPFLAKVFLEAFSFLSRSWRLMSPAIFLTCT